jgi:4-hydroxy-4-methyl-2-oxoglutarate aldolase
MTDTATPYASDEMLALFEDLQVAIICDSLDLLNLPSTYLCGVLPIVGRRLLGRAHTVERISRPIGGTQATIEPNLGLGVQMTIDSAKPGDVIVLASGGELDNSIWGGNMGLRATSIGVAGVVTDGMTRDVADCEDIGLPLFTAGVNARRSLNRMVSLSIGKPIVVSGVWVRPGDIVVGDDDGVVIVPTEHAEAVAKRAVQLVEAETKMQDHIRAGNSMVDAIKKFKS